MVKGRMRALVARGAMALALVVVPASALLVTAHPAAAAANCDISRFSNPDGSIDTTGYLQCIAPGVNPSTIVAGASVTFTGGGCAAATNVAVSLNGTSLGSTTSDSKGNFSAPVTIPSGTPTGTQTLTASCLDPSGNPLTVTATVTVVLAASLPRTGTNVGEYVGIALALIALGSAAAFGAHRELAKRRIS